MSSGLERTSGLEDIMVQRMPCNSSDANLLSLQRVYENTASGATAGLRGSQDHVLCDRRRRFRMGARGDTGSRLRWLGVTSRSVLSEVMGHDRNKSWDV